MLTGKEKTAGRIGNTAEGFDTACRQERPASWINRDMCLDKLIQQQTIGWFDRRIRTRRVAPEECEKPGPPGASKPSTVVLATLFGLLLPDHLRPSAMTLREGVRNPG